MSLNMIYNVFVFLLLLTINSSITIKEKSSLNIDTKDKTNSFLQYDFRKKHLDKVSLIDQMITNFVMMKKDDQSVKDQIKLVFKQVGDSVNDINEEFKENYEYCVDKLQIYGQQCSVST
jgi:hypothetical protein